MAISYDGLMALKREGKEFTYTDRDIMLYAAAIGVGADPVNRAQLAFVYEKDLKVMPSVATVLAWDDGVMANTGLNFVMAVHGEQRLTLHAPIPTAATIRSDTRVADVFDKGEGRGALIVLQTTLTDMASETLLATMESVVFARGDGGFGGPAGSPEPLPAVPERAPDHVVEFQTLPQAALFYRLCGDRNPLHCDLDFAAAAGFERPILHGLCTWGNACHAVVQAACDYQPERMTSFAARFSAPVYPGERLSTEIWQEGAEVHFRTSVPERETLVLSNGYARIDG